MRLKVGDKEIIVALDVIDIKIIQLKTPVLTGLLRDSFALDGDDIVNPVGYAGYVEFGTSKMPGAFMVQRSAQEIQERLAKKIAAQLNDPKILKLPEIVIKVT